MEHRLFQFWETVCRPSWKLNFSAWSALSLYQNGILSVTVVPHCGSWICVGVEAHTGWQHSSNGSSIHTVSLGLSQPETFPVEVRAKEIQDMGDQTVVQKKPKDIAAVMLGYLKLYLYFTLRRGLSTGFLQQNIKTFFDCLSW